MWCYYVVVGKWYLVWFDCVECLFVVVEIGDDVCLVGYVWIGCVVWVIVWIDVLGVGLLVFDQCIVYDYVCVVLYVFGDCDELVFGIVVDWVEVQIFGIDVGIVQCVWGQVDMDIGFCCL